MKSTGRFDEMVRQLLYENDEATCPACGGSGIPLGHLGSRSHFRCRNCGLDFSRVDKNQGVSSPEKRSGVSKEESLLREENVAAKWSTRDRNFKTFDEPNARLHKELLARGFVATHLIPTYWYQAPSGKEIAVTGIAHPEQSMISNSLTWRVAAFYTKRGVVIDKFRKNSTKDGFRLIPLVLRFVDKYLPLLLAEPPGV